MRSIACESDDSGWRRPRVRFAWLLVLACVTGVAVFDAQAVEGITGDHRLIRQFVDDAAIVRAGWLEASADYARVDGGRDYQGNLILAFRLGKEWETGVIASMLDRSRDAGARQFGETLTEPIGGTGLGDARVYAKYRLLRTPVEMSLGAMSSVPLGDEDKGRGSGSRDYGAFVGLRTGFRQASLVLTTGITAHGDAEGVIDAPGQTSLRAGVGLLVPLSIIWTFLAEAGYQQASYEGGDPDGRAMIGVDWRPTENTVFRGGLEAGLTAGAPDRSAVVSVSFHF